MHPQRATPVRAPDMTSLKRRVLYLSVAPNRLKSFILHNKESEWLLARRAVDVSELGVKDSSPKIGYFNDVVLRYCVTPYLLQKERGCRPPEETLELYIVDALLKSVGKYINERGDEEFRGGQWHQCGSVAEGTKVGYNDEFDYQYLIDVPYQAAGKPLLRTRGRVGYESKSYFQLHDSSTGEEIIAKEMHDKFLKNVSDALAHVLGSITGTFCSKKAGPAVKIIFRDFEQLIKIDVTLGIKANPSDLFDYEDFTAHAQRRLDASLLRCHFVPNHDYWKLCFTLTEQEMMNGLCSGDPCIPACYKVIKGLRDEVDIKDKYGDGILQSYPIKVTFEKLALDDNESGKTWRAQDIGHNVVRILQAVEERGQGPGIKNLFLEGEDILGESDRSYLESRRIMNELKRIHDQCVSETSIVLTFTVLFLALVAYFIDMSNVFEMLSKMGKYRSLGYEFAVGVGSRPSVVFLQNYPKTHDTASIVVNVLQLVCLGLLGVRLAYSEAGKFRPMALSVLVLFACSLYITVVATYLLSHPSDHTKDCRASFCMMRFLNTWPIIIASMGVLENALESNQRKIDRLLHSDLLNTPLVTGLNWDKLKYFPGLPNEAKYKLHFALPCIILSASIVILVIVPNLSFWFCLRDMDHIVILVLCFGCLLSSYTSISWGVTGYMALAGTLLYVYFFDSDYMFLFEYMRTWGRILLYADGIKSAIVINQCAIPILVVCVLAGDLSSTEGREYMVRLLGVKISQYSYYIEILLKKESGFFDPIHRHDTQEQSEGAEEEDSRKQRRYEIASRWKDRCKAACTCVGNLLLAMVSAPFIPHSSSSSSSNYSAPRISGGSYPRLT